jgi:uncharacterized protein YgbK (DUF1537 family)
MRVAIVTDDLTSATDGSVAFAEGGWSVHVARGLWSGWTPPATDILSVDVGSRVIHRHEAVAGRLDGLDRALRGAAGRAAND